MIYAVRRFTPYRHDGQCFELYNVQTGECESFPGTRKALEKYAKRLNADRDYRVSIKGEEPCSTA